MSEPVLKFSLPLTIVNTTLNALAQNGANVTMATQLIQAQAQQQLNPPPQPEPSDGAANDSNVVPIDGNRA